MSRYNPHHDAAPVLAAAAEWADRCLRGDGSIFVQNEGWWVPTYLDELDRRVVQGYDGGEGNFIEKLKLQLNGSSHPSIKLMAEVLWILLLFQSNVSARKKREIIRAVWSWTGMELNESDPKLSDSVLGGLGSGGAGYNTHRWRELAYLLTFVRSFKRLGGEQREATLSSASRFSHWLAEVPQTGHRQFPHIIGHLLFPDQFERIGSVRDKRAIITSFDGIPSNEVAAWDRERLDRALFEIRQRLEAEHNTKEVDFYEGDIGDVWRKYPRKAIGY